MTGHELFESLEKCLLACHIGKREINLQHFLVEFLDETLLFHDRTNVSSAEQSVIRCYIVVKRLCAELVSHGKDLVLRLVIYRKRKHSVDVVGNIMPPFLVCFEHDFPLTFLACKRIRDLQLLTELLPVPYMSSVINNAVHAYTPYISS